MAQYSTGRKLRRTTSGSSPADGHVSVADQQRKGHSSHRTERVKIRGLVLDPPGMDGPVEVCVNYQADWDLIYRNPAIHVKCLVESCDTRLMAKRMSRSGLRFLAARSGGCAHNLVEMQVGRDEIAQDPSTLVGGGGPEGQEHLWMKGRLFKIVQRLGAEAVVEHSQTHADVFLPEHGLVLEYQRWHTDFRERTAQRSSAGARTVWMLPWQPPGVRRTPTLLLFNREVFQHGGIYVAVRNKDDYGELQRPWENPSQERTARLYASGSIAVFDPRLGALVRKERSLATVLDQIISGDRLLTRTLVLTKGSGRQALRQVWALRDDLAMAESAREGRRHVTKLTRGIGSTSTPIAEQPATPETQSEEAPLVTETAAEEPRLRPDAGAVPSARASAEMTKAADRPRTEPATAPAEPDRGSREARRETNHPNDTASTARQPPPTTRRAPWWEAIVNWFRRT